MSNAETKYGNYALIDKPMNKYYRDLVKGMDYGATMQRCVQIRYKGEFFADVIVPVDGENLDILMDCLAMDPYDLDAAVESGELNVK